MATVVNGNRTLLLGKARISSNERRRYPLLPFVRLLEMEQEIGSRAQSPNPDNAEEGKSLWTGAYFICPNQTFKVDEFSSPFPPTTTFRLCTDP